MPNAADALHAPAHSPARYLWAVLLARIYEILPLDCGRCGAQMRLIAFVTDPLAVKTILGHLREPTTPPEVARSPRPPAVGPGDRAAGQLGSRPSARAFSIVVDQRLSW